MTLVSIFLPYFEVWVSFIDGCHLENAQRLVFGNCMTPYDGCGEFAEFPNFGSVQRRGPLRCALIYLEYCTLDYPANEGTSLD
jgi:hypothetical protein